MTAQIEIAIGDQSQPWRQVKRCDVRARELADRHYSRQTPGAAEFMSSGITFVMLAEFEALPGPVDRTPTRAAWGAIENLDPGGGERFRCSIFRNETPWLSSYLVREATTITQVRWARRFGWDGDLPLTTEVDPAKTRRKRDPGRCFRKAGWWVIDNDRRGLVVLQAPFTSEAAMITMTTLDPVEKSRTYRFPGGETVRIDGATHFVARESGTHRLRTSDGRLHIVPTGWIHIEIEAEDFTL